MKLVGLVLALLLTAASAIACFALVADASAPEIGEGAARLAGAFAGAAGIVALPVFLEWRLTRAYRRRFHSNAPRMVGQVLVVWSLAILGLAVFLARERLMLALSRQVLPLASTALHQAPLLNSGVPKGSAPVATVPTPVVPDRIAGAGVDASETEGSESSPSHCREIHRWPRKRPEASALAEEFVRGGRDFHGRALSGLSIELEMHDVDFSDADLRRAFIKECARCNFARAKLDGASFMMGFGGSDFDGATLVNAQLSRLGFSSLTPICSTANCGLPGTIPSCSTTRVSTARTSISLRSPDRSCARASDMPTFTKPWPKGALPARASTTQTSRR